MVAHIINGGKTSGYRCKLDFRSSHGPRGYYIFTKAPPIPRPREDPKSRIPKVCMLTVRWCRLRYPKVDLLFGSAQGFGLLRAPKSSTKHCQTRLSDLRVPKISRLIQNGPRGSPQELPNPAKEVPLDTMVYAKDLLLRILLLKPGI